MDKKKKAAVSYEIMVSARTSVERGVIIETLNEKKSSKRSFMDESLLRSLTWKERKKIPLGGLRKDVRYSVKRRLPIGFLWMYEI